MFKGRLIPGVAVMLLSACSAGVRLPPSSPPPPVPPQVPGPIPTSPPAGAETTRTLPPPARDEALTLPLSPAAATLLAQASTQRDQRQFDAAAATLERALRLAPTHPEPWLALAAVRLEQQRPEDAEGLARRALSLGGGMRAVRQRAWSLIARTRQARGDIRGAQEAQARADRDS
ncbi:MAG TPA: tetratricopeptide repeat protein [Candidatus Macondimonas sp.]|nr:tetratricopeptide repeat protein [Candidatus Macondimonas sp.]